MHLRVTLLQTIIKLEDTYNVHVLLKLILTNILLDTFWTAIEWMMFCKHRASSCYTHFSGRMKNVWSRSGRRPHLHHKTKHALKKYVTITVNHNALQTEFKKKKTSWEQNKLISLPSKSLSNRQRISPSKQWPFPANCDSCLSNGQARIQDFWGSPAQTEHYTFTSTTCRGMHYYINYFEIHPERLKETLASYNHILPPFIAICTPKSVPTVVKF